MKKQFCFDLCKNWLACWVRKSHLEKSSPPNYLRNFFLHFCKFSMRKYDEEVKERRRVERLKIQKILDVWIYGRSFTAVIFKKQCTWFNWEEMRVEMVSSGSKMVQLQPIIFLFSDFSHDYLALAWIFNKTQRRQCIRKHGETVSRI